jgi:hypothetical protein
VDSVNRHDFQIHLRGFEGWSHILPKVLWAMRSARQLLYAIMLRILSGVLRQQLLS